MDLASIVGPIGVVVGGVLGVLGYRRSKRQDLSAGAKDAIEVQTADRLALVTAVETLQEFYEKFTGDLRVQVEKLIADKNQQRAELDAVTLRESECRVELTAVKVLQAAQGLELVDLRKRIEGAT